MANTHQNQPLGSQMGTADHVLTLISSGVQILEGIGNTVSSISETLNSKSKVATENRIKVGQMEAERQKAELEFEKFRTASHEHEQDRELIRNMLKVFMDQHQKYLEMNTEQFMSDTVTARLKDLNGIVLGLIKELRS